MSNLTDKQRFLIAGVIAAIAGFANMIGASVSGESVFYSTGILFLVIAAFFLSRLRSR